MESGSEWESGINRESGIKWESGIEWWSINAMLDNTAMHLVPSSIQAKACSIAVHTGLGISSHIHSMLLLVWL